MSYWTFSDQFEEPGPPSKPFHGGFGLLNVQWLTKPAYFAYRFLNELGDTELTCADANVWACRDDRGGVQVLFWDYHQPKQDAPNATYYTRDLSAKALAPARVVIDKLAPGEYDVNVTRVGYRHNDIYTAYLDLGSPAGVPGTHGHLPDDILAKLRAACSGAPETRRFSVGADGMLFLVLPMNENDVYLVSISK
jgi:xylan 1,4-beta-xylosidase